MLIVQRLKEIALYAYVNIYQKFHFAIKKKSNIIEGIFLCYNELQTGKIKRPLNSEI